MCFISVSSLKLNNSNWGLIILKIVLATFLHKREEERTGIKNRIPLRGLIRRFPKVQLSDCVRCEKRIRSGQIWDRLRERVCVCDLSPIFTVLEVEGWTQGIKCLSEIGDIRSKRWRGWGWKNFKNCSELLWILFLKEKLLLTQKQHVKTVEKNDSLFPLTYPRKENGWKENMSWMYKNIAKLWLLIRNIWPCSVSVKYSGLHPYECFTNEVTEDPQESSKHSDRSFHIGIILLRILFPQSVLETLFFCLPWRQKRCYDRAVWTVSDYESRWNLT